MSSLDTWIIVGLALWALGSLLFCFRLPGLHPFLVRLNPSKLFVHWSLFSPNLPGLRPGMFELVYRDHGGASPPAEWRSAARGHGWAWHACVWMPERITASAVQNLGREIKAHLYQEPPDFQRTTFPVRILRAYVERRQPRPPGTRREIRLLRRFASRDVCDECVLIFPDSDS